MGAKVKFPLWQQPRNHASVERDATVGAVVGVNLFWQDGTLVQRADFALVTAAGSQIGDVSRTLWSLIVDVPANVQAVAALATDGFVRRSDDTWTASPIVNADLASADTGGLDEGSNLYFTDERAQDAVGNAVDGRGDVPLAYDDATGAISASLSATGVTATSYGDATHVATFTVDAKGRLTAAGTTAISFPASPVSSVFGRTGAVVAASGDYTFAQIGSKPTTLAGYGITDAVDLTSNQSITGGKTFLDADLTIQRVNDTATNGAAMNLRRARTSTAVQSGDIIGRVLFWGHDGTAYQPSGAIVCTAAETWVSGSAQGTEYRFETTATGSTTRTSRWLFRAAGHLEAAADNTYNFGSASKRAANGYITNLRPGAGAVIWTSGSGTPEGSIVAPIGSLYTRTDGGAGTTLYVKESGAGNTGWVAK